MGGSLAKSWEVRPPIRNFMAKYGYSKGAARRSAEFADE
jgi:hypothetical protein